MITNILKNVLVTILVIFVLALVYSWFYTVQPGNIAIEKVFWEVKKDIKREWLHFKIPFIATVQKINIRNIVVTEDATAASKDIQDVTTKIAVNFSIDPLKAIELYKTVWDEKDIEIKIVSKATQEAVKASTAQFSATESITKRSAVRDMIIKNLKDKLENRWILINQVDILDFTFSKSFNDSIEAKVTAEQNALKAEKDLERIKFEAQQEIERAKAEAEKIRIQAEAITKQGGAEYVQLQWISKWNGVLPSTALSDWSSFMLNLKQ